MVTLIPNDTENNFRAILRELIRLEERIKALENNETRLRLLENKVSTLETYFIGAITDNTHYVSSASSWTGKKITITNGLIKTIET